MILDAFFHWIWIVFWLIFSIILERFWIDFYIFREFAKTPKIAPRSSESTKINGLGGQGWHQNQKITHRNLLQHLKRKIIPKWSQNKSKIEAKLNQKGINKSMFFWFGFGMALETLMGLRGGCEWTAGGTLSPADPPGRPSCARGYQTKTGKEGWLGGSNTPRAVGPANFGTLVKI